MRDAGGGACAVPAVIRRLFPDGGSVEHQRDGAVALPFVANKVAERAFVPVQGEAGGWGPWPWATAGRED